MSIALPMIECGDDADQRSRVAFLARLIEADEINLDCEEDVWRCLFRNGVGPGEAFAVSRDVIEQARQNQMQEH